MTIYVFIIAVVLPNGMMDIKHTLVPECPSKEAVETFMNEKVKSGEVTKWAGTCAPLKENTTEL